MMVTGVLLLIDAGLTLAWQEPVSAVIVEREQAKLEKLLEKPPPRVLRKEPLEGDAIGKIDLPSIDRSYFIVEGTDVETLRKGPGHYPETPLPGQRGTVAIAGHRTTYGAPFRKIDQLGHGDRIVVAMPYGTFVYRVERSRIVSPDEFSILRPVGYDRLVLSACHPLYSAAERIVVFARLTRRLPSIIKGSSAVPDTSRA
jgi:sortase A